MRASIIGLALLLTHLPAYAEQWDETNGWFEQPDDMVCTVMIDGTEVLFTYRSGFKPEVLPVEGMLCKKRNYEQEAKDFQNNNKLFDEMFPTGKYDTPPGAKVVLPIPKEKPPLKKEDQLIPLRCLLASHPPKDCPKSTQGGITMARKVLRIEINTAAEGGEPVLYYITIEKDAVRLIQPDGREVDLSLLANAKAAQLRFALEDAATTAKALSQLKRVLPDATAKEWKGLS